MVTYKKDTKVTYCLDKVGSVFCEQMQDKVENEVCFLFECILYNIETSMNSNFETVGTV